MCFIKVVLKISPHPRPKMSLSGDIPLTYLRTYMNGNLGLTGNMFYNNFYETLEVLHFKRK